MKGVVLIGECDRKPQHLPIGSLKHLGTNEYGEALFRVVWSESRMYLVGGKHKKYYNNEYSDDKTVKAVGKDPNLIQEEIGYKWLPLYPGPGRWILEMWKSPFGFTGCTPQQWEKQYRDIETGLLVLGPYPDRGDYSQCLAFPETPTISVVENTVNRIRAGWNYTANDHKAANEEQLRKQQKEIDSRREAIFKDAQQAFNNRPSNVRPGKRTKDRVKIKYTADQVGIRSQRGLSTGGR